MFHEAPVIVVEMPKVINAQITLFRLEKLFEGENILTLNFWSYGVLTLICDLFRQSSTVINAMVWDL